MGPQTGHLVKSLVSQLDSQLVRSQAFPRFHHSTLLWDVVHGPVSVLNVQPSDASRNRIGWETQLALYI